MDNEKVTVKINRKSLSFLRNFRSRIQMKLKEKIYQLFFLICEINGE